MEKWPCKARAYGPEHVKAYILEVCGYGIFITEARCRKKKEQRQYNTEFHNLNIYELLVFKQPYQRTT
jgi:hypothetical protein